MASTLSLLPVPGAYPYSPSPMDIRQYTTGSIILQSMCIIKQAMLLCQIIYIQLLHLQIPINQSIQSLIMAYYLIDLLEKRE